MYEEQCINLLSTVWPAHVHQSDDKIGLAVLQESVQQNNGLSKMSVSKLMISVSSLPAG